VRAACNLDCPFFERAMLGLRPAQGIVYLTAMRHSANSSVADLLFTKFLVLIASIIAFAIVPFEALGASACEVSFKSQSETVRSESSDVYVLKFDTGAGFSRVVSSHRFIGRNQQGDLKLYQSHELFPIGSSDR